MHELGMEIKKQKYGNMEKMIIDNYTFVIAQIVQFKWTDTVHEYLEKSKETRLFLTEKIGKKSQSSCLEKIFGK